jgi:hypothetical protein
MGTFPRFVNDSRKAISPLDFLRGTSIHGLGALGYTEQTFQLRTPFFRWKFAVLLELANNVLW